MPVIGHLRIIVASATPGCAWAWTAYLEEWDGTEWRYRAAEDGDTPEEAEAELRAQNRKAKDAKVEVTYAR